MTLRARLAVAFAAILLAPVAVGVAALAGLSPATDPAGAASGSADAPAIESARRSIQAAVQAHCQALSATATGLAVRASEAGQPWAVTPVNTTGPWAICGVEPGDAPGGTSITGLAARAEIRDRGGSLAGYAYAVQPLDEAFVAELSAAAGARVRPGLAGNLGPYPGQPLPLQVVGPLGPAATAAPPEGQRGLLVLVGAVALLVAGLLGLWVASTATRPLRRLLATLELVAAGELNARSLIGGRDEAGRLGRRLDDMITAMQEMQRLSVTDALTGLGNVRHLGERLRVEIERATRFGRALGVLALDLDHFKDVNDRFGHGAGDHVLVELATRLRRAVREVDLSFRRGGEEFVILLPETDVAGSLTAAGRVGAAVRDTPFPLRGRPAPNTISITVSIGVAVFPRHARTGADLLEAADQALYTAKHAGRDAVVLAGASVPAQWLPDSIPSAAE